MDNKLTANNRTKTIFGITLVMLLVVCAVSAVKRIFVGLDVDEEYAVTLAYRIAKGDILMKEMSLNIVVSDFHNCAAKRDNTDKVRDCHHTV